MALAYDDTRFDQAADGVAAPLPAPAVSTQTSQETGKKPDTVMRVLARRAGRYRTMAPALAASNSVMGIEEAIAEYPHQIALRAVAISTYVNLFDARPSAQARAAEHAAEMTRILAEGHPQWDDDDRDLKRYGNLTLDLLDVGQDALAGAVLDAVAPRFDDPGYKLARSYQRLGRAVPGRDTIFAATTRAHRATAGHSSDDTLPVVIELYRGQPRARAVPVPRSGWVRTDAADDAFRGYEVMRPDVPTNAQWENWIND